MSSQISIESALMILGFTLFIIVVYEFIRTRYNRTRRCKSCYKQIPKQNRRTLYGSSGYCSHECFTRFMEERRQQNGC